MEGARLSFAVEATLRRSDPPISKSQSPSSALELTLQPTRELDRFNWRV